MKKTTAIIAYGSLINPLELAKREQLYSSAVPVRVSGYRRSFAQEPSWRKGLDTKRAVLRVDPSEEHSFNGLLLPLENKADLAQLDERERGYTRHKLTPEQIRHFAEGTRLELPGDVFVYAGKPAKHNPDILPNPVYKESCLDGAKRWGDDFYKAFLSSTFVKNGTLKSETDNPGQS